MASTMRPAVVMDCGTGYTKLGFAGNAQPSFVIPTVVGCPVQTNTGKSDVLEDLAYTIGEEAVANSTSWNLSYPIKQGLVENWDHMEKFWQSCIWQHLQVNPEDHNFVLTEPPMNPPENREYTAEIMFETFNAAGLFIGRSLTGTVIDAGEGVTHIIPVVDGYVIGSSIKSLPLAGRDVTLFVQQLLRERGEPVPPDMSLDIARQIKERFCYTCSDIAKEFARHDADPAKYLKQYVGVNPRTGKEFVVDVAYERFIAPEMFFNPEIYSSTITTPLPQVVDDVIQSCPIDTRRSLYGSVVLSGGCTMLKDYGRRLQRDLTHIASAPFRAGAPGMEVNVLSHPLQRYAVWYGGSVLAMTPEFPAACHTRQQYQEYGPSICRSNYVFRNV